MNKRTKHLLYALTHCFFVGFQSAFLMLNIIENHPTGIVWGSVFLLYALIMTTVYSLEVVTDV